MAVQNQEMSNENGYPPVGIPGLPVTIKPDHDRHFVVAAIDFGTTYSGYAFAFKRDPDSVHMMRKWEGGDPGITNMKVSISSVYCNDNSNYSLYSFLFYL